MAVILNSAIISIFVTILQVLCEKNEAAFKVEVLFSPSKTCERKASNGDQISMHYIGTLEKNGEKFDASYDRNQPFVFTLGAGQVIPGWEQGIPGMCIGEKRKLTLPSSLAYGDQGFGNIIPPHATLIFEIELVSVNGVGSDGTAFSANEDIADQTLVKEELDNYIDESASQIHDHQNSFEELDLDNDGGLTSEEMSTYIRKFQETTANVDGIETMPYNDESIETIVSEIFQEDDKNKDGIISRDEYMHASLNEDFDEDLAKDEL